MFEYRYSSTETFLVCRRRFNYEYVWEIEPNYPGMKPPTWSEVGSAFHAGAHALYSGKDGHAALEAYIKEHKMENAVWKGKNTAMVARGCYARFVAWTGRKQFDNGMKPVLMEEKLRLELFPNVVITGIPDRVDEDQFGRLHIRDYKTVGQYNQYTDFLEMNRQGRTYALLVEAALGKPVDSFTLIQVHRQPPKSNPMPVNPLTTYFTDEEKVGHLKHLEQVVLDMVGLTKGDLPAYAHPGQHCGWCPYQKLCITQDTEPEHFETMKRVEFRKKKVAE